MGLGPPFAALVYTLDTRFPELKFWRPYLSAGAPLLLALFGALVCQVRACLLAVRPWQAGARRRQAPPILATEGASSPPQPSGARPPRRPVSLPRAYIVIWCLRRRAAALPTPCRLLVPVCSPCSKALQFLLSTSQLSPPVHYPCRAAHSQIFCTSTRNQASKAGIASIHIPCHMKCSACNHVNHWGTSMGLGSRGFSDRWECAARGDMANPDRVPWPLRCGAASCHGQCAGTAIAG